MYSVLLILNGVSQIFRWVFPGIRLVIQFILRDETPKNRNVPLLPLKDDNSDVTYHSEMAVHFKNRDAVHKVPKKQVWKRLLFRVRVNTVYEMLTSSISKGYHRE